VKILGYGYVGEHTIWLFFEIGGNQYAVPEDEALRDCCLDYGCDLELFCIQAVSLNAWKEADAIDLFKLLKNDGGLKNELRHLTGEVFLVFDGVTFIYNTNTGVIFCR
jgi:hypothetical protein